MHGDLEVPRTTIEWLDGDDAVLVRQKDWDAMVDAIVELVESGVKVPQQVLDVEVAKFALVGGDDEEG